jgi:PAS domain S-box-containing protein
VRDFQSITHPDDLEEDLGFVRRILKDSVPFYHLEKRYIHKKGRIVWALLSVSGPVRSLATEVGRVPGHPGQFQGGMAIAQ